MTLYKRNRYTIKMQELLRHFLEQKYEREERAKMLRNSLGGSIGRNSIKKRITTHKKTKDLKLSFNSPETKV